MFKDIHFSNRFETFPILYCGHEVCMAHHNYGPAIREHYVLHFIKQGKGSFTLNNQQYNLRSNQCFMIFPHTVISYHADKEDPWEYYWVAFNGEFAAKYLHYSNISITSPIVAFRDPYRVIPIFKHMIQEAENHQLLTDLNSLGIFYQLFSLLCQEASIYNEKNQQNALRHKDTYIKRAIQYMQTNYSRKISVSDIAGYIGLERSYFTKLFVRQLDTSPHHFLNAYRIEQACRLLSLTRMSIKDIADSVGFPVTNNFTKTFKIYAKMTPNQYRKSQ